METLLASSILTRIVLGFQAGSANLQKRLPGPWQVAPIARGAFKGTNLLVLFNDELLNLDAAGNTTPDAMNRFVGFAIPATHPEIGEMANFPFRVFAAHPQSIPGRYRTVLPASVWREQVIAGTDLETTVTERFGLRDATGATLELRLRYRRGVPSRVTAQINVRSVVDPAIHFIHLLDQLVDVVRSIPTGVDRVETYEFHVALPELGDLFDGTEQLMTIAVNPWHVRQVFEP